MNSEQINISEIVAAWPKDEYGWSISPGVEWCAAGTRIKVGEGARIDTWASIGEGASIGERASIGARASIGEGASIGERASIGSKSSEAVDIGFADGYRKCIACVDGIAYIGAGCRWFSLNDAIKHWASKPDRVMTMALMESAKAIANLKGWKWGEE